MKKVSDIEKTEIEKTEELKREISRVKAKFSLQPAEAEEFVACYQDHLRAFELLTQFDSGAIDAPENDELVGFTSADNAASEQIQLEEYVLDAETVKKLIDALRDALNESDHFGQERQEGGIEGIIGGLRQGIGAGYYPTAMHKAARIVYAFVKNHVFVDGNKRIAAFLFCWFIGMHNSYVATRIGKPSMMWILVLWIAQLQREDLKPETVQNLIMQFIADHSGDKL